MSILTNSSFCIKTIRNYTIDPATYNQHMHKDLLQLTNQLLKDRDRKKLKTHIEKVKSHTDVEHNETADKAARAVVDGENCRTSPSKRRITNRGATHMATDKAKPYQQTGTRQKTHQPQSRHKKRT
jgi:hypothetical protein